MLDEVQDEVYWANRIAEELGHGKGWAEVEACEQHVHCPESIAENEFVFHTFDDKHPHFRVRVEPCNPELESKKERDPWGETKEHPREDWRYEVANGDTNLGYWDWVDHKVEEEEDDDEDED